MNYKFKIMKKGIVFFLTLLLLGCNSKKDKSDAYGTFESTEVTVSSEANGKLISLNIEEGQLLKTDAVIGIVDTTDFILKKEQLIAQKNALEANRANIESQINVQKQQKENILIDKDRIEKLLKDKAATPKQLDDINGSIKLIDKQIASVETQNLSLNSNIESINKQISQVNESIKKCYIKNPIDGTVLTKYAQTGEIVAFGKAIYKIADMKTMYLRAYVSETQLTKIKIGQKVEVLIDKDKSGFTKLEGTISWISQSAEFTPKIIQTKEERVNLVYAVKILVINDGVLKIGMPGECNF